MASYEWHFRLDGDEFDIKGVTELFEDEVKFDIDANGHTHLVMDLPYPTSESQVARDAAEELLTKLNAIAQIMHGNHENIRIGAVGCKDPSGAPMHLFVHVSSSIRGRSRVGISGIVVTNSSGPAAPTPKPKMIGDRFLGAADKDENLERALHLFGSLPLDWRGLYMVLEAAEDAHSGEKGLIAKQWVPNGQIKRFKATANSYKALRLAARHGTTKSGVAQATITLPEARDMVRTILEKWAKGSS